MDKPLVAARRPKKGELKEGKDYFFCACGRSKSQPFCDGSHRGTGFSPQNVTAKESGDAFLCQCKRSANQPYCDGSHKNITDEEAEAAAPPTSADKNSLPIATVTVEEPHVEEIHELAKHGLSKMGHHGEMGAMGVPGHTLPLWDDIQILTAQMATKPLLDSEPVATDLVIGPKAKKPLIMKVPLFVSDMSVGALSEEAKESMARGAELAGTGICSGEGGILPEEQQANSRYLYELASAQFGYEEALLSRVQAFHFKGGQGAKTGTGGHLPGNKVTGEIAQVRNLQEGTAATSPATLPEMNSIADFRKFANRVREVSGGVPIGVKLSANHIEEDIDFALDIGVDYIILDGRGGGTGAAPLIFRNHISVPSIPEIARARRHLDKHGASDVTLIATGGLRTAPDFVKAMCLGAGGVAIANSAMQAIGCVGARMCNTNMCPAGIATQKPELRARLKVDEASERLGRFLSATTELMQVLARACGHNHTNQFTLNDLTTWKRELSDLSGVPFAGVR